MFRFDLVSVINDTVTLNIRIILLFASPVSAFKTLGHRKMLHKKTVPIWWNIGFQSYYV